MIINLIFIIIIVYTIYNIWIYFKYLHGHSFDEFRIKETNLNPVLNELNLVQTKLTNEIKNNKIQVTLREIKYSESNMNSQVNKGSESLTCHFCKIPLPLGTKPSQDNYLVCARCKLTVLDQTMSIPEQGVSVIIQDAEVSGNGLTLAINSFKYHTLYIVGSLGIISGKVQLETTNEISYSGDWRQISGGEITVLANGTIVANFEGQFLFFRCRISTLIVGGTVSVLYVSS